MAKYDIRSAVRAKDGTLYRAGRGVEVSAEHVKEFGWNKSESGAPAKSTASDGKLPKVSELESHLAGIEDRATIERMKASDDRSSAQEIYDARLAELGGGTSSLNEGRQGENVDDPNADD